MFEMFLKKVSYVHQGCIYLAILLQFKTVFYFNKFHNVLRSCDGKAEFSEGFTHSSVSRNHSVTI